VNTHSPNGPFDSEATELADTIRHALLELHCYTSSDQRNSAPERSIETLVSAGALRSETAGIISRYRFHFYGFNRKPIKPEIPVLQIELAGRATPLRLIGFRDGHVEVVKVQR
jgi:hypothetical protein